MYIRGPIEKAANRFGSLNVLPERSPTYADFLDRSRGLVFGPSALQVPQQVYYPIHTDRRGLVAPDDCRPLDLSADVVKSYKVVVRSREGSEMLWTRGFRTFGEAFEVYARLIGLNTQEHVGRVLELPSIWVEGELDIRIATVSTYNSSNSTNADWGTGNKCPSGVTSVDYLVVAQGGGGGNDNGAGGGAGGMRTGTGLSVTPGTQYTITVGSTGGAAGASSTSGEDSTFSSIVSTGGGRGGSNASPTTGLNGGSGGGSRSTTAGSGGTGTAGQGNNGGDINGGAGGGASGGGAGGAGSGPTGSPARNGANGGLGSSSSISGSSVGYAGGGAGCGWAGGGSGGTGTSGGGNGSATTTAGNGTDNLGGGGGGTDSGTAGTGGKGVIILSWTVATLAILIASKPHQHILVR